jgi:hypothetical protein
MAKIRNKSGEERVVPGYGLVGVDEVFEVPDGSVKGFTCQDIWERVDKPATKKAAAKDG